MTELQDRFFQQLIKKYGEWDKNSARFGKHSYGNIADDLSMSASQFSKLLYGTATNGMYERTIRNIARLLEKDDLKKDNERLTEEIHQLQKDLSVPATSKSFNFGYLLLAAILASVLGFFIGKKSPQLVRDTLPKEVLSNHSLADYFEPAFKSAHVSPFVTNGEAQSFCPCSAFEGTWALAKEYTIPVPVGKPGLYYVAKKSDIKMRCSRNVPAEKQGSIFMGFENMEHELWLDINREPISPKYFDLNTKNYTKAFYNINFEEDPSFQKVANINSFMYNTFEVTGKEIIRKGETIGRYAKDLDEKICKEYEIDVEDVMSNIIGNLTKTVCQPVTNHYCNPNQLVQNESLLSFNCNFTIAYENLGIGGSYPYTKSLILKKQNYSDNLLCNCSE